MCRARRGGIQEDRVVPFWTEARTSAHLGTTKAAVAEDCDVRDHQGRCQAVSWDLSGGYAKAVGEPVGSDVSATKLSRHPRVVSQDVPLITRAGGRMRSGSVPTSAMQILARVNAHSVAS